MNIWFDRSRAKRQPYWIVHVYALATVLNCSNISCLFRRNGKAGKMRIFNNIQRSVRGRGGGWLSSFVLLVVHLSDIYLVYVDFDFYWIMSLWHSICQHAKIMNDSKRKMKREQMSNCDLSILSNLQIERKKKQKQNWFLSSLLLF